MAKMFDVNPQAISKHIHNIYKEGELSKKATSSKMELVQNELGRTVRRQVDIYNLDMLIAESKPEKKEQMVALVTNMLG